MPSHIFTSSLIDIPKLQYQKYSPLVLPKPSTIGPKNLIRGYLRVGTLGARMSAARSPAGAGCGTGSTATSQRVSGSGPSSLCHSRWHYRWRQPEGVRSLVRPAKPGGALPYAVAWLPWCPYGSLPALEASFTCTASFSLCSIPMNDTNVGTKSNKGQAQGNKGCGFFSIISLSPGGRITSLCSLMLVWEITEIALLVLTQGRG